MMTFSIEKNNYVVFKNDQKIAELFTVVFERIRITPELQKSAVA